jgi:hypothetical protein
MSDNEILSALRLSQGDHFVSHDYYDYVISKIDRCQNILNIGSGSHFIFEGKLRQKIEEKNRCLRVQFLDWLSAKMHS